MSEDRYWSVHIPHRDLINELSAHEGIEVQIVPPINGDPLVVHFSNGWKVVVEDDESWRVLFGAME